MRRRILKNLISPVLAVGVLSVGTAFAQTAPVESKQVNFRYSQNPKIRTKPDAAVKQANLAPQANMAPIVNPVETSVPDPVKSTEPSIAVKTMEIAKRANTKAIAPTEVYKVGAGDVLFINLQNAAKASSYFTVLNDGTIDYPLAGEMVAVSGMTVDEIEDKLKSRIKLYDEPQVSVKVREYSSHTISVLGLVERTGDKSIQREAVPLFVIKAEAVIQPKAAFAVVKRANSQTETLDLKDAKSDDVLIFPGDIVEFTGSATGGNGEFYFIGGDEVTAGQKDFHQGLTLSQAIIASGGTKRVNVKKVIVRRKGTTGLLVPTEYSLKNIKDGKDADPLLQPGDTVEVGN